MEYLLFLVLVLVLLSLMLGGNTKQNLSSGPVGAANQGCGCGLWLVLAAFIFLLALGLAGVTEVDINAHPQNPSIEMRR